MVLTGFDYIPPASLIVGWCIDCGQDADVAPVIRFGNGSYGGPCEDCWRRLQYPNALADRRQRLASFTDRRQRNH